MLLVLAATVPLIGATAWIAWDLYHVQRQALGRSMIDTARALTAAADRELAAGQTLLETLALTPFIDEKRFDAFYEVAVKALASRPGTTIVLFEPSGQVVFNTARSYGTPLPNVFELEAGQPNPAPDQLLEGGSAYVRQVLETGRPNYSDLFVGRMRKQPLVAISVPVLRDGRAVYCLSLALPVKAMQDLLAKQRSAGEGNASLVDRRGFLIARAPMPEKFIGQRAPEGVRKAIAAAPEGFDLGSTLENLRVFFAHTRSDVSGWTAAVGVTEQAALGLIWRSLGRWIAAIAILLGAGLAVAVWIARRIADPMRALAVATQAMQRGESVAIPGVVHTRELEQLGHAVEYAMSELRRSSERLHVIMDNMPALIAYVDAQERYRFNNRVYERWLGKPLAQITGREVRWVLGENEYAKVRPQIERALRGAQVTFQLEYRLGGERRHAQTTYLPDFDAQGKVCGFYVLAEDIGSLVQAHKEVRESKERLQFALEGSRTAIWDTDLRSGKVFLSAAWQEMLGGASEESHTNIEELKALAHPEDLDAVLQASRECMEGVQPEYTVEHRVRANDGRWIWILSRGRVLERDPSSGRALRMMGSNIDITERKLVEQRMEQLAQHDPLTGLANRSLFNSRVGHAIALARRIGAAPALLYLDIDGFKSVNERLGQAAGDALLKELAARLRSCVRESDAAARLGGAEFAVLLEIVRNEDNASRVAQKIL